MIVPLGSTDPFWENEARTVLTAAIAYACYSNPPEERPMHAVLDVLFGGKAWDNMILGLRLAIDVRVMTQHATALAGTNEKTLSSVLQTARSSLGSWTGERVARATASSDWNPHDLRSGAIRPSTFHQAQRGRGLPVTASRIHRPAHPGAHRWPGSAGGCASDLGYARRIAPA